MLIFLILGLKLSFGDLKFKGIYMPDNLPELRDIHIPQDLSSFPMGYGWWVIVLICILSWGAYKFIRLAIIKSKKRYALKLLNNNTSNNIKKSASAMSEVLRRICVYKYPEALVLSGNDWIEFLNKKAKSKLDNATAKLLVDAPYMPSNSKSYNIETLQ